MRRRLFERLRGSAAVVLGCSVVIVGLFGIERASAAHAHHDTIRVGARSLASATASPTSGPLAPDQESSAPSAVGAVSPTGIAPTPIDSAQAAVAKLLAVSSVTGVSHTDARRTTWGAYRSVLDAHHSSGLQVPDPTVVWVAAVAGSYVPEFGHGAVYPWGVTVFDAATGQPLADSAGQGSWPAWWSSLPAA